MKRGIVLGAVAVVAALAVWGVRGGGGWFSAPVETVRLAISRQIMSSLVMIADAKGYFRDEGLDVILESAPWGKDALRKVIEGTADVATVAEVPVMAAVLAGSDAQVFAIIQSTDHDVTVMARKDLGIQVPADLVGKRIGVIPGTNHEYFLHLFLAVNNIDRAAVEIIPVTKDDGAEALISGRVDALSSWVAARLAAQTALPGNIVNFECEGIYTELWTLAARPQFLTGRPKAAQKLLRALLRAEEYAAANRQAAVAITADGIEADRGQIDQMWDDFVFSVSLDQSLLAQMEGQARQAIGTAPVAAMPDFLAHIAADALRAVEPGRVTIVLP